MGSTGDRGTNFAIIIISGDIVMSRNLFVQARLLAAKSRHQADRRRAAMLGRTVNTVIGSDGLSHGSPDPAAP